MVKYTYMKKGEKMTTKQKEKIRVSNTGKKRTILTRKNIKISKLANKNPNFGIPRKEETRKKIGDSLIGHNQFNTGRTHFKKGHTPSNKGIKRLNMAGDKNPAWKGGITPENRKIRTSIENEIWRNSVFSRDGYMCQKTGIYGKRLVAHHILNFSNHPELRFAIDNGITLSKESHIEFHKKYGTRNNTLEQLLEFLNNK